MTSPNRSPVRHDDVRRHNLGALLGHVHAHGELSRADLTNLLGLNRSTIRALVSELVAHGLVEERIPISAVRAGRPSHVVGPRDDGPYVVAAAVGVREVVTAAIGLGGTVLCRREHVLHGAATLPDAVAGRIAADVRSFGQVLPTGSRLVGIGISVPGVVRASDNVVEIAPNLKWRNVNLAEIISRRVSHGVPIRVGNDGNLGALAEHTRGAGQGERDVVYVATDVGVGGGIMVDGLMLRGAGGFAGEIGHMALVPDGPPCQCGSNGCLESMVGEIALLRACGLPEAHTPGALTDLFAAADAGNRTVIAGIDQVASWLGLGLASLVNIFNPHVLIVGGSLAEIVDRNRDTIERQLDARAMSSLRRGVDLRLPALGSDSSLLGAAEIAFAELMQDPMRAAVPA